MTWRTEGQSDFSTGQTASFILADSADWQEVKVELPAAEKVIHVRLAFEKSTPNLGVIEFKNAHTNIVSRWSVEK